MRAATIAVLAPGLLALLPLAIAQAYPVTQGKTYKFEKVADGVYYATGGFGSNNVVIVNDQDVLLVDDGTTPAAARAFLDDIKAITNKPVRTVVNTHFHYDHTDGNSVFGPEVQIIAHDYVRMAITTFDVLNREPFITSQKTAVPARIDVLTKQIATEKDTQKKAALQRDLAAAQTSLNQLKGIKPTPPNVTYSSKMVLYKSPREIQLLFLGRGHTGGDTVVFLPRERIVCTGDLMESQLAYMGDAFFDEWVTTLGALKNLDFGLVLPGHGAPFGDKGLITAFQGYLSDITKKVADLRAQGLTADQAATRVDLTSHAKDFPQITGPGADARGVRRIYAWMDERGKK
jgi:cyclase